MPTDREQLALAFRLAERFGFHEGICNHFSLRVDQPDEQYLINPYGLHWSEIEADTLLLIDGDGRILEGVGEVEDTARFIHVAGHRANARHRVLLHTHMPWATTLTLLAEPAGMLQMALLPGTCLPSAGAGSANRTALGDACGPTRQGHFASGPT